jgi:hypothetical protein
MKNRKQSLRKLLVATCFGVSLTAAPVMATPVTVTATGGSTGDVIINNGCTHEVDSGAVLTGCLNSNHDSDVHFSSNELLQFGSGGGQATVNAQDGLMSTITIDPVSFTLNELILNIDASANGFAQFCDNMSCFGTLFAISGNGSNFFDITFSPTADFLQVNTFSNSSGTVSAQLIADTSQWRVGVSETTQVPEPASIFLFGPVALLGLAWLRRRRQGTEPSGNLEVPLL